MDVSTTLIQKLVIPFYHRRWGLHAPELRRQLNRTQYLSPDALRARQWQSVRETVENAAHGSPFYRERFRELGFEPGDLKSWSDFEALPLLTKEDVRANLDSMIHEGADKESLFHKRTGGSTGVPVHLYWDSDARRHKSAVVARHDGWAGFRLGMKRAALWGDTDKRLPWKERLYKALCERTIYLDTLKMDAEYLHEFVGAMRRHRPFLLVGHAHSLYFFTEFLVDQNVEGLSVGAIISTAEALSSSERTAIEAYFGPVVFDRYGCEELSLIASECEAHDGLHVSAEGLYVEVLDEPGASAGRLVVTDLTNRGMPFLRYEVGDMARFAEGVCSCGRGLPRLEKVFGRTSDILYAPDGRKISGISILDTFVIHVPGVRQAQIVQDAIDHVHFNVVRDENYSPETETRIRESVLEIFGPEMGHDIRHVDSIQPTPRGKYQFSVCEIDPPEGGAAGRPLGGAGQRS